MINLHLITNELMPLNQFIINDLTPSSPETLVKELQTVFKQLTYSHIPILKEHVYWVVCQKRMCIVLNLDQGYQKFFMLLKVFLSETPRCG